MKILYFAWLRQKTGTSEEDLSRPQGVETVADLVAHLAARGGGFAEAFADLGVVRCAVNQDYVPLTHPVAEGDEVAFFPPVTGG